MSSLSLYVDKVGMEEINRDVVELFDIKYGKCGVDDLSILNVKPIYESIFGKAEPGDEYMFDISDIEQSIQLKANKCIEKCVLTLKALSANYDELLVSRAEYIIIKQGTLPIFKLTNYETQDTNIYISCDILYLENYIQTKYNMKGYLSRSDEKEKFNAICCILVISVLCGVTIKIFK
jgi:hypothetical protein